VEIWHPGAFALDIWTVQDDIEIDETEAIQWCTVVQYFIIRWWKQCASVQLGDGGGRSRWTQCNLDRRDK
jgi:hypothetical protein